MKKKLKYIIVAVVLTIAAVCGGIITWNIHKKKAVLHQQNYVASKLIEMGEYEQGRILSAQTEQMKPNDVSKRLLVLAAGFQTDYEVGILYADQYLELAEDKIISSARSVYQEALDAMEEEPDWSAEAYLAQSEAVRQELLPLLLQVQNSIPVKKNDESVLAVLDLMTGQGSADSVSILEDDDSLLAQKAQLTYAVQTGDYGKAYEKAEALYLKSNTLENRAALANLAAAQAIDQEDKQTQELRARQAELSEELYELEERSMQESSASKQSRLIRKINEVQREIEELEREINAISALKAINFMEATTPISQRNTVAYRIELAQLYYRASEEEKAKELLMDLVSANQTDIEPISLMLFDFLRAYKDNGSQIASLSYMYESNDDIELLWNRIAQMLGFVENGSQYGEGRFIDFFLKLLDELYNGLIIRDIDATDFPTVRVTVNVAMELEHTLKKENFSLVEMGNGLEDFELLNIEDLQDAQKMSVVLVVDHSGSMGGTPLEDTKQAVTNFVKTIDEEINAGLVVFDDSAQLISGLAENKSGVLRGIASLEVGGGTNIYSGLELAGKTLESQSGRKVVILLSDGADGNVEMIDEVLDGLASKEIYVYTIGFGGADTDYLSYIARKCGGKFIQADSSSMLMEIYSSIGEYMVNDYVIEFNVVTDPEKFTRTVKVSTDVNGAFSEREYYVGVPYEKIEAEQDKTPLADYFQQIGGSMMEEE